MNTKNHSVEVSTFICGKMIFSKPVLQDVKTYSSMEEAVLSLPAGFTASPLEVNVFLMEQDHHFERFVFSFTS